MAYTHVFEHRAASTASRGDARIARGRRCSISAYINPPPHLAQPNPTEE